jgi:uncharacterized SAM-dependent methyltransferase
MLVEYSHKYDLEDLDRLARQASMKVAHVWTDPKQRFAVAHMVSTVQWQA